MKYLKRIFEHKTEQDHRQDLDTILSVNDVLTEGIDTILNDHKIEYKLVSIDLFNLPYGATIEISGSGKYRNNNSDNYLERMKEHEDVFGIFDLEQYSLFYIIKINRNDPIVNGLQALIDDLSKRYKDVGKIDEGDKNFHYIKFQYDLKDYIKMSDNIYRQINK